MDHLGARFGLVVFDECHHLPSGAYSLAARSCLAPYRLGLTATPERTDGREADLDELDRARWSTARTSSSSRASTWPSTKSCRCRSSSPPKSARCTTAERAIYRAFLQRNGIRMGEPAGLGRVHHALVAQRRGPPRDGRVPHGSGELAFAAPAKLDYLEQLLLAHRADRAIIFTQDNATAYDVSRRFLVPVITHQTKVKERSHILAGLSPRVRTARW